MGRELFHSRQFGVRIARKEIAPRF